MLYIYIYPRWCRISSINGITHPNLVEDFPVFGVRPASSLATASVGNPAWETQIVSPVWIIFYGKTGVKMILNNDLLLLGILEIQVLFEKKKSWNVQESQFLNFVFLARFPVTGIAGDPRRIVAIQRMSATRPKSGGLPQEIWLECA